MTIICYDGSKIECRRIEIANAKPLLIIDDCRTIPIMEVLRIIEKPCIESEERSSHHD